MEGVKGLIGIFIAVMFLWELIRKVIGGNKKNVDTFSNTADMQELFDRTDDEDLTPDEAMPPIDMHPPVIEEGARVTSDTDTEDKIGNIPSGDSDDEYSRIGTLRQGIILSEILRPKF